MHSKDAKCFGALHRYEWTTCDVNDKGIVEEVRWAPNRPRPLRLISLLLCDAIICATGLRHAASTAPTLPL